MKKRITWNSAQTWVIKIVKIHNLVCRQPSAYRAKPKSQCYIIYRFLGMVAEWSEYCALFDAVRGPYYIRISAENLHWLIIDEVATWISERSMQKTSVAAFLSKYYQYTTYRQNFADIILWQHRNIHRSISSLKRKCGFMLKSDIKSSPSAADPFFPGYLHHCVYYT